MELREADKIFAAGARTGALARLLGDSRCRRISLEGLAGSAPAMLFAGTAMDLIGKTVKEADGSAYEGLGLASFTTEHGKRRIVGDVYGHTDLYPEAVVGFMNKCSVTEDANPLFHRLSLGFGNGEDKGPEGFMRGNVFATHLTGPILVKNPDFTDFLIRRIFERKGWELPEQLPVLPYEREAYEVTLRELMGRAGG